MPHASWFGRRGQTRSTSCSGGDRRALLRLFARWIFAWEENFSAAWRLPDGQEGWNAVEYYEIVPYEKIVSLMYISDPEGKKIDPAQLGIEPDASEGAYGMTLFEDLGNGQTKLTFIGNEPMESAKNSGQLEGWNEILEKVAAVIAELAQAK
jgi:uncharacterized protein YndB with AHSA1/START domain